MEGFSLSRDAVVDKGPRDSEPMERAVRRFYRDLEMTTARITEEQQKEVIRLIQSRENGQAGSKPVRGQLRLKVTD